MLEETMRYGLRTCRACRLKTVLRMPCSIYVPNKIPFNLVNSLGWLKVDRENNKNEDCCSLQELDLTEY